MDWATFWGDFFAISSGHTALGQKEKEKKEWKMLFLVVSVDCWRRFIFAAKEEYATNCFMLSFSVARWVCNKNRPKCSPIHFLSKFMHYLISFC
jgi:hypothetical protein